jgi:hypothetical protein
MLVKMLDEAQKLGITCEVSDEGYWDNRNIEELVAIIDKPNVLLATFTSKLKDSPNILAFSILSAILLWKRLCRYKSSEIPKT